MGEELQKEAWALGGATRHRLLRYVAEVPGPVGAMELTDFVQLRSIRVPEGGSCLVLPASRPDRSCRAGRIEG